MEGHQRPYIGAQFSLLFQPFQVVQVSVRLDGKSLGRVVGAHDLGVERFCFRDVAAASMPASFPRGFQTTPCEVLQKSLTYTCSRILVVLVTSVSAAVVSDLSINNRFRRTATGDPDDSVGKRGKDGARGEEERKGDE
ncbi:hypothetical protein EYF80_023748 [Liparis tanakae]|uniref:Uncharacterized protein n=1 Tax=Liparis tanakae TaxID=230148 RepID=A0A4Z2HMH6_9TELE|nr:hypothetical protein EYF80_023748 [Liparis tanakae]